MADIQPISVGGNEAESDVGVIVEKLISGMSRYLSSSNFGENMATGEVLLQMSSVGKNDGKPSCGSADPYSDNFDLVVYLKEILNDHATYGLNQPTVGITYEDLEIYGDGLTRRPISTFGNALIPNSLLRRSDGDAGYRKLMSKTSGFFKPGEMTLVLGRPGAGCSTFLREIAGSSQGLTAVNGKVLYNQIGQKDFRENYPSFVVYNPEDDFHYPTLTVRETLRFALECRVSAGTATKTRQEVVEERMQVILKMLGLLNCADTFVGNEVVRGCSGGERKRVSLAEMWCLGVSVGLWDGSTKGLDSSTALDFIRALRLMTDISNTSHIVSIYQASEEIYDLFDKVILISDGHIIYFGPAKNAPRDYFAKHAGLIPRNRSTTPDFLTGLMDKDERRVMDPAEYNALGLPFDSPPLSAAEMEKIYLTSHVYSSMMSELAELKKSQVASNVAEKFKGTVSELKRVEGGFGETPTHASRHLIASPYFTSRQQQFAAACKREVILAKRDFATVFILVFSVIMAFVIGLLFFQLKISPEGMAARTGVLFFALVYMTFNCLATVPLIIQGRAISGKHKTSKMYRTHLQVFATQMTNAPAILVLAIFYACANYWLVGLRANVFAFLTFIFTNFLTNQAFGSIIRLFATVMPDLSSAMSINAAITVVSVLSMGYIVPYETMPGWFKIFYWINPLQYGVRALFQNEYGDLSIDCDDFSLPVSLHTGTPQDNLYASLGPEYKACLVTSARLGDEVISGNQFIKRLYGYGGYNLYLNWLILLGFTIMFYFGMMFASKYFGALPAEYNVNVWKSESAKEKEKLEKINSHAADIISGFKPIQTSFTWKHIDYTVVIPKTGEKRQLLKNVQGYVKSGEMVALMGSSGAGKTTLMDCITQRKTEGDLKGQIYVRDQPQDVNFKSKTAYCEQMDVHNPFSTVRESVYFAARLRQSADTPLHEKEEYAEYILHLLELDSVGNAMVGRKGSRNGISMEQRKRLTIACELASKPEILFLDEPTSGLDSQSAFTIIRLLRKLADLGQAVLCTIHQPSAVVFDHFDKVLLLARGGQTVYFGDLGHNCETMIEYFTSLGADACPASANPAEWMLDVIGAGITTNADDAFKRSALGELMDTQWWVKTWAATDSNDKIAVEIDSLRVADDAKAVPIIGVGQFTPAFACGEFEQFRVVYKRMLKSYWRNPLYTFSRLFNLIWTGLWVGFAFFNTKFTAQGVNNKCFSLFQVITQASLLMNISQPNFYEHRNVFLRERSTGVYSWMNFSLALILSELPYILFSAAIFTCCFYFPTGMNRSFDHIAYFFVNFSLLCLSACSLGMALLACLPSLAVASALNPLFSSTQLLNAGISLPRTQLPLFFQWIYYIDPYHYFAEAVVSNEIRGHSITCDTQYGAPFRPAPGQTCGEYMKEFMTETHSTGLLVDYNATDVCYYCPYSSAETFLQDQFGWSPNNTLRNTLLLCCFYIFNCAVMTFFVWRYKAKR